MKIKAAMITIIISLFLPIEVFSFCFKEAAEKYQVDPYILIAIAQVESKFNPYALNYNSNGSVDIGLMQINSLWQKKLKDSWKYLFDPCFNVIVGAWILRDCIDRYGYNWKGIGCYHSRNKRRMYEYARKVVNTYNSLFPDR